MTALPHELKWLKACLMLAPEFSTCTRRQYFAVTLAPNKRVAGIGYNGAPPGMRHCTDGGCPRSSSTVTPGSPYDTAEGFCVAQHAEAGALLWSDPALRKGGTLVVNGPPCMDCARLIASSGITRVVHVDDPTYPDWVRVARFLSDAGVTTVGVPRPVTPCDDVLEVLDGKGGTLLRLEGEEAREVLRAGASMFCRQAMANLLADGGNR